MQGTSDLQAFSVLQTLFFFSEEIGQQDWDNKRKKAENKAIAINIAVGITMKVSPASPPSLYFLQRNQPFFFWYICS